MAIIEQLTNMNPATLSAMCTRELFQVSAIGEDITSVSAFNQNCDIPQVVFADSADSLKNDYTSMFAIRPPQIGAIVTPSEFWLIDEDCNEIVQFTDNTYGTYYPEGTWNETPNQEKYSGFIVDWFKIFQAFGGGIYKLKTKTARKIVALGFKETCSCSYMLTEYSDEKANETVRMEVVFNSYYINSGEDYRGINWPQMYRVRGTFGNLDPKVEKDNYLNSSRQITDIQDTLYNEYTFETYHVPFCFSSEIVKTGANKSLASVADEIYLTNYNISDHWNLKRVPVVLKSIKIPGQDANSNKVSFEMTFEDRDRTNVKRTVR